MTTREKRKIIRDYIKRNNPYNTVPNLMADFRISEKEAWDALEEYRLLEQRKD